MSQRSSTATTQGRVVHCKREPYDVYIGRPSKWGNPIPVPGKGYDRVADPENILGRYEEYIRSRPELMASLHELHGKVLGCWCAPQRCHGDVLVKLANESAAAFDARHPHCSKHWKHGVTQAVYKHASDCQFPEEHAP